ncbi:hypothetical protein LCGC14_0373030 [marine sediment metagenome]|uniref:Uncharacterized protein n=1 Tax=marine sediment metagenome TaxID=412755 RepID=A0A0F9WD11_9ZZZZ
MELAAIITGYLVIGAACIIVMFGGTYWTIYLIVDAIGVRKVFLEMKRERDEAWATIREINEVDTERRRQEVRRTP